LSGQIFLAAREIWLFFDNMVAVDVANHEQLQRFMESLARVRKWAEISFLRTLHEPERKDRYSTHSTSVGWVSSWTRCRRKLP